MESASDLGAGRSPAVPASQSLCYHRVFAPLPPPLTPLSLAPPRRSMSASRSTGATSSSWTTRWGSSPAWRGMHWVSRAFLGGGGLLGGGLHSRAAGWRSAHQGQPGNPPSPPTPVHPTTLPLPLTSLLQPTHPPTLQDVLDLIEGKMGILDLLDESCRFPTATNKARGLGGGCKGPRVSR